MPNDAESSCIILLDYFLVYHFFCNITSKFGVHTTRKILIGPLFVIVFSSASWYSTDRWNQQTTTSPTTQTSPLIKGETLPPWLGRHSTLPERLLLVAQ